MLNDILKKFAASGWDLIAAPSKKWLAGEENRDELLTAIRQASAECSINGCEYEPLYKQALELLRFRPMRRTGQQLPDAEARDILTRRTAGTLALMGDDGYPYAVPLSYAFCDGKLYFHCAKTGHKIDAIRRCDKASFCVIDRDDVIPEDYTTHYRSVIAFGRVRFLESAIEMRAAIEAITAKYSPDVPGTAAAIDNGMSNLGIIEFTIEHLTGKEALDLAKQRA